MRKYELKRKLIENHVPDDMYSLEGGLPNEAYCLSEKGSLWEVYYSERGKKTGIRQFKSEQKACDYLYALILDTSPN